MKKEMKLGDKCLKGIKTGALFQLLKAIVHVTVPYRLWGLISEAWNSGSTSCWLSNIIM